MDYNQLIKNLFVRLEENGVKLDNAIRSDVYTFVNLFHSCDVQLFQEFESTKKTYGFNSKTLEELCHKVYSSIKDDKVISSILFNNYFNYGYSFHLTNGYNAKKISETGIGPEYKDMYNAELIELMNSFGPNLRKNLFIFAKSDTKTTSYSGSPLFSSRYGNAPEWFLEYSGSGQNLNKDKEKFIENALTYVELFEPTPQELDVYISNLQKYWDIYSKSGRSLILIPNKYIYDIEKIFEKISDLPLQQSIQLLLRVIEKKDGKTEKSVPSNELIIEDGFGNTYLYDDNKDYDITIEGLVDDQDIPKTL